MNLKPNESSAVSGGASYVHSPRAPVNSWRSIGELKSISGLQINEKLPGARLSESTSLPAGRVGYSSVLMRRRQ